MPGQLDAHRATDPGWSETHSKGVSRVLGGNIKRFRLARGYSQETMAELAEITDDRFLRRIERGEVNMRFGTLIKLAEALAVEPDLLVKKPKPKSSRKGTVTSGSSR